VVVGVLPSDETVYEILFFQVHLWHVVDELRGLLTYLWCERALPELFPLKGRLFVTELSSLDKLRPFLLVGPLLGEDLGPLLGGNALRLLG